MAIAVRAIYENGVLRPDESLTAPEGGLIVSAQLQDSPYRTESTGCSLQ
jgi:predicted DNA-binding antitoxin AbrB/MazE fold protein